MARRARPKVGVVWMTWRQAMQAALYGPGGFYARGEPPARHFRTSVHVSPSYAEAIWELLRQVDAGLGHPERTDLVDIGAGGG
jgi:SAM-dependent MidA family methyltransferase